MRALSVLILVTACASRAPAPAAPATRADTSHADTAAVRALIARTEAANNASDVEGWLVGFADDAIYMAPGMPAVTTRDALREVARTGFANRANVKLAPVEIVVAGDWAFARVDVSGTVVLVRGDTINIDMKEIVLFRREPAGGWKISRLISNSNR